MFFQPRPRKDPRCDFDFTEEEAIMAEFGAQLEAEAEQKALETCTTKKTSGNAKSSMLDPDDEEAMIMAEYNAACTEEVPDDFLGFAVSVTPPQNTSDIVTPEIISKTCYKPQQVFFSLAAHGNAMLEFIVLHTSMLRNR